MLPAAKEEMLASPTAEEIFSLAAGVAAALAPRQGTNADSGKKPHQEIFSENRSTRVSEKWVKCSGTHQVVEWPQSETVLGPTNYLYDGLNVVEEMNNSGGFLAQYTDGTGIDDALAELRAGTASYYHADGLGSFTSLSNSAGALVNTYTYDSFGNTTASTGTVGNYFQYTARELDPETSLYFYRARYYDQTTGRFLSEDPVRFAGGITFYQYAANDPVGLVDWSGNCPIDLNQFVNWLDHNAKPGPTEFCAHQIRLGLESVGANTRGAPVPAKDWGSFLTKSQGFSPLAQDSAYSPQVGDIAVFQPANGSNPAGHIEVWDGTQWVSDYKQGLPLPDGTHFYPNRRKYGPQPYVVYRCN